MVNHGHDLFTGRPANARAKLRAFFGHIGAIPAQQTRRQRADGPAGLPRAPAPAPIPQEPRGDIHVNLVSGDGVQVQQQPEPLRPRSVVPQPPRPSSSVGKRPVSSPVKTVTPNDAQSVLSHLASYDRAAARALPIPSEGLRLQAEPLCPDTATSGQMATPPVTRIDSLSDPGGRKVAPNTVIASGSGTRDCAPPTVMAPPRGRGRSEARVPEPGLREFPRTPNPMTAPVASAYRMTPRDFGGRPGDFRDRSPDVTEQVLRALREGGHPQHSAPLVARIVSLLEAAHTLDERINNETDPTARAEIERQLALITNRTEWFAHGVTSEVENCRPQEHIRKRPDDEPDKDGAGASTQAPSTAPHQRGRQESTSEPKRGRHDRTTNAPADSCDPADIPDVIRWLLSNKVKLRDWVPNLDPTY